MHPESRKSRMSNAKTVSRKAKTPSRVRTVSKVPAKKPSTPVFQIFSGIVIVLFLALGVTFYWDETHRNPLIGKWRAETKLGILEIQFDRKSMLFFGTKTPVCYDIQADKVIVFDDDIKVGNAYKILDQETISTEAGGYKTVYKKVK
ncbi:hypothetical protein [Sulfurospirillum cavolei]|uniref:hypothetical protein n=1 Tax=Sulfurospirillum cavolei TaxID=366522 RepID=UPI003FA276FC